MPAKLLQLISPTLAFFKDADMPANSNAMPFRRLSRPPHMGLWLVGGWVLIILKCVVLWWLIERYHVPIHPLWLVFPTVLFGALATTLYVWRK